MNVTRILQTDVPNGIAAICKALGFVRADVWRRYGALKNVGKSNQDIRAEISAGITTQVCRLMEQSAMKLPRTSSTMF